MSDKTDKPDKLDKKAAIQEYKRTVQPLGILQIRNLDNGKLFIESSKNLPAAFNRHKFQLKLGSHPNLALQADYTKSGIERFAFEVLDTLKPGEDPGYDSTDDLKALEAMWFEKLQPYEPDGYHRKPRPSPR